MADSCEYGDEPSGSGATELLASDFFRCCKILQHGASGFTSSPNAGMLQFSITLKNPLLLPGLKSWALGPVSNTLTITPLGRINTAYKFIVKKLKIKLCIVKKHLSGDT
jgi:hypothetical protein